MLTARRSMHTLFPEVHPPRPAGTSPGPRADAPSGPFAVVALEQGIDRVLDYAIPPRLAPLLQVGQRVRVPLGKRNRPTHGYVVSVKQTTGHPSVKKLFEIEDERVLINPALRELAREDLEVYAVDELEDRIAALKAEIARTEARLDTKKAGRSAADSLFKF